MRKFIGLIVVMLMVVAIPGYSADYDLEVEFSYIASDPVNVAVGYNVYAGSVLVCSPVVGADPTRLACDATGMDSGSYDWSMEALWAVGGPSPRSDVFVFTLPAPDPNKPNIIVIRLRDPAPVPGD